MHTQHADFDVPSNVRYWG